MDGGGRPRSLAGLAALAAELGDLKRVRDAASPLSLAARIFRCAWGRVAAGEDANNVALSVTADALAAIRLGGIDARVLCALGAADSRAVLERGFDEVSACMAPRLAALLREELGQVARDSAVPDFVDALIRQPRAGATCPGRPRLVLEPAENHGDHCLVVAVLGVVLSAEYGADPTTVFLAGLAHHLHNAVLPDSGFAGEMLLGDELTPLMQQLFERALTTLAPAVAAKIRAALATIGDADTPEGRAFHAADVIDRVQQMRYYERVAHFTASQALEDLQLVHAGPVQTFHHAVLDEAGLR